jgi:hypothetical protein
MVAWLLTYKVSRSSISRAISAAAGYLSVVTGKEILYLDRSASVELDNLVVGLEGSAPVDVRSATALLECNGIFAYICPPDVIDCAMIVIYCQSPGTKAKDGRGIVVKHTRFPDSVHPRPGRRR